MQMEGRFRNTTAYRYGFNGKEKDDEVKGVQGSSLDFGARIYDSRLARWASVDRAYKAYVSTYEFGGNSPLTMIDPDGKDEFHFYRVLGNNGYSAIYMRIVKDYNNKDVFFHHLSIHRMDMATKTSVDLERKTQFYPFSTVSESGLTQTKHSIFGFEWETDDEDRETLAKYLEAFPDLSTHLSTRDFGGGPSSEEWGRFFRWKNGTRKQDALEEKVLTFAVELVAFEVAASYAYSYMNPATFETIYRVQGGGSKIRFAADADRLQLFGNDMLFVNFGEEARALEFLAKRGDDAVIVRFRLNEKFTSKIRSEAVAQNLGKQYPLRPQISDPTMAPNQFGIPSNYFQELLNNVEKGSFEIIQKGN